MKKIILTIAIAMAAMTAALAQDNNTNKSYTINGKSIVANKSNKASGKSGAIKTDYTYQDVDGKTYDVYLSKNGRAFIKRVSQKSGKEYNKYLDEQLSRDLCKELGITYVEKTR